MEQSSSTRTGSVIPVSTHQTESTVLPIAPGTAWEAFKRFHLEKFMPTKVKATSFTTGGPDQLDSVVKIDYTDGASWEIRIVEISNIRRSIGYEVISTEPAHSVSSILGVITIKHVTDENHSFIEWSTDFSNDADAGVIAD